MRMRYGALACAAWVLGGCAPQSKPAPAATGISNYQSSLRWLYDHTEHTDYSKIRDMARYPELVFLNKLWFLPPAALGFAIWYFMGWSGLLIGFFLSTAILWHGTFTINSLSHIFGSVRYKTGEDSKNNWLLAIITMGEGWHNNHHHFMGSTRQGFYWWEIDVTYYILRGLQAVGLVWDIKEPPARVYEEAKAHALVQSRSALSSEPSLSPESVAPAAE